MCLIGDAKIEDTMEDRQIAADIVGPMTPYPNVQELLDSSNIRIVYLSIGRTIDVAEIIIYF